MGDWAMVWHGLAWSLVLVVWGVWSFACWLAQLVVGWDGWRQGGDWAAHVPEIPVPEWLAAMLGLEWVQALRSALVEWGPELQGWLQSWPDLGAIASGLVTTVWVVGTVVLVLVGLALSAFIAFLRRASAAAKRPG
ncbi:MAG: hypothetical protein O9335_10680 [Inhella sp.]|jgi:hypothetical protein|nr:hypothetical protein [Inhella sp.]